MLQGNGVSMPQGTRKIIVLAIAMLVIALPASAAAQSPTPTNDGYEDSSITYVGGSGDPANPGSSTNSGGSLPFSGLDLFLVGGLGVGLVLLGVGMRRVTRVPDPA